MGKDKQGKLQDKVESARKQAVDTIIEMMESKGLMWVQEWGNAFGSGAMPRNGATGRWYSGGNSLHLMASAYRQGFKDPRWFTFKQADAVGYHPEKGSKASLVEYYKRFRGMKDADGNWTTNEDEAETTFSYMKLVGCFWVFNAEQLFDDDGEKMPPESEEPMDEEPEGILCDVADELIATSRCPVIEKKGEMSAFYRPGTDEIHVPSRLQFSCMEGFVSTLAHEMTHSTRTPLHRRAEGAFGSEDYAYEELVAELGSTFVCLELGVHRTAELEGDENFKNHAAYLKSWLKRLRSDTDYLFKAASEAGRAANYIIGRYNGEEEAEQAA